MKHLTIVLALSLVGACTTLPAGDEPGYSRGQQEMIYKQERMREQQRQHGAGGCAPNFVTGGCL